MFFSCCLFQVFSIIFIHFQWIKLNFPRLLLLFSMGTTTTCGPKTCAVSWKTIVYGAMSQVKSRLLFVLRMKTIWSSLIVLKIGIARITKSSLGFATLLYLPFISNLVVMKMLRMFRIFWVIIIPLLASLTSINFWVFLLIWNKHPDNRSMSSFLVCSLFGISWRSLPILSRILQMQQS